MKRFADYNPTKEEIIKIFGSEDDYKDELEIEAEYPDDPDLDTEKLHIAELLDERGKREEARKIIESIEDESYRETCLQAWCSWGSGMNEAGDRVTLID